MPRIPPLRTAREAHLGQVQYSLHLPGFGALEVETDFLVGGKCGVARLGLVAARLPRQASGKLQRVKHWKRKKY